MNLRKIAVSFVLAGAALATSGGTASATADPVTIQGYYYVAATYPNTPQGWRDCGNATVNVNQGHCKLDSETGTWVNLWAWHY
ncbi:hypothetical protein GCM10010412_097960 [Nonomuraea recticatena]|uniref:Secreted protein n=1 Tax=Nonomuraea recticatena TaxID=46178 RepID=A0ABP6FUG0_9ACTN